MTLPVAGWRVWYADGAVYDSRSSAWEDLPELGVVVVVVYHAAFTAGGTRYRKMLDGGDWYWPFARSGTTDERGAWVDPPRGVAPELLKRGVWVSDLEFDLITQKARGSSWP